MKNIEENLTLEECNAKRSSMKGRKTNFKNFLNGLMVKSVADISEREKNELSMRLDKFQIMFAKYDELQTDIEILNSNALSTELEIREEMERSFYELISSAQSLLLKLTPSSNQNSAPSLSEANSGCHHANNMGFRLPLIKICNFDGTYFKWLEFRDTFNSLIHNNDAIKPIHKFHYLNSYLEGEAAQVICNLEVTDANYVEAWRLLCERYNNKKQLINNHMNSLFNLQPIPRESAKALRHIIDHVSKNLRALTTLGLSVSNWDPLVIHMISAKLDSNTNLKWEESKSISSTDITTLEEFFTFLKNRADILESIQRNKTDRDSSRRESIPFNKAQKMTVKSYAISVPETSSVPASSASTDRFMPKCVFCNGGGHRIYDCSSFLEKSVPDRISEVAKLKLCFNCLRKGHHTRHCKLGSCNTCKKRHNTLLHREDSQVVNTSVNNETPDISDDVTIHLSVSTTNHVLLSTAVIDVYNPDTNNYTTVRALLDSGSQTSIITENLKKRLRLTSQLTNTNIVGIGKQSLTSKIERCFIKIQSKYGNNYTASTSCLVLPEITGNLPHNNVDISQLNLPKNIKLADPTFHQSAPVEMLIGADLFWSLIGTEQISLGEHKTIARESKLGWILAGPIANFTNKKSYQSSIVHCNHLSIENKLDEDLTKFWEIENVPEINKRLTDSEIECEEHYVQNTYRTQEGRFSVRLPLVTEPDCLGNSYKLAKKRFIALERRFKNNSDLKREYTKFIHEYKELGHLSESDERIPEPSYFIPHHAVIKPSSESTKLRVVFNGSAPTTSGYSVNDIQMVGPHIQDSLFNIILRFRCYKYVISGDVEKMYRQCLVDEGDRPLQLILWRDHEDKSLKTLRLNTITYGYSSASFLSTRCLWQLGQECEDHNIKTIIQKDFLVDDLLTGSNSEKELHYIKNEVERALSKGCFNLRKYRSNLQSVLTESQINNDSTDSDTQKSLIISSSSHTLGVGWNPNEDIIHFPTNYASSKVNPTKRSILSDSCKIFDPLGLLSLLTIQPKILIQKLWIAKLKWDDPVPREINLEWQNFVSGLNYLPSLHIPRHVLCDDPMSTEIHCFCDASQMAYAACVYIRSITNNGTFTTRLLCAKARVAPVKATTIPRLELCAAVLGAKLTVAVNNALRSPILHQFYWTDSTIVLSWLRTDSSKLKTFVANRTVLIQELTEGSQWSHVPSNQNPADLASRGVDASKLLNLDLWWNGPLFLRRPKTEWPVQSQNNSQELPELKVNSTLLKNNHSDENNSIINFESYSKLSRLQRSFAYLLRFLHNCRNPNNKKTGVLQPGELNLSFDWLVRLSQQESFPDELKLLRSNKTLNSKNPVVHLTPFLNDNILRVGGRLDSSKYSFDKRHPMLLHSKHKLTKLLFQAEHLRLLHAGPQLLLSTIRERVWPIAGRDLARTVVHNCTVCRRFSGKTLNPMMGSLPSQRITPDFPFVSVGVDFAGPFLITDRKGRGCKITKCYLCLYVCMRYKCVHLEAVSELSKDAFILSLRRFISRRGKPADIYCDNGRNFVAASKEINEFIKNNTDSIADFISSEGIRFHFSPAYAPHFGGLWEAGIKSAKYYIKRILGNTHLTFEELASLFSQVEALLNSRPLYSLSSSPNDFHPLTPGHFLIGRALTSLPSPNFCDTNENRLDRFQKLEKIRQHFWKRWMLEYISELQQKTKWRTGDRQVQVGDLMLIKEENCAPMHWRLGRVTKLFPGDDGITRVVEIVTSTGTYRRGVRYLCPLLEPGDDTLKAGAFKAPEDVAAMP